MSNTERERMKGENWESPPVFPLGWVFTGAWRNFKKFWERRKMKRILKSRTKRMNLPD